MLGYKTNKKFSFKTHHFEFYVVENSYLPILGPPTMFKSFKIKTFEKKCTSISIQFLYLKCEFYKINFIN